MDFTVGNGKNTLEDDSGIYDPISIFFLYDFFLYVSKDNEILK